MPVKRAIIRLLVLAAFLATVKPLPAQFVFHGGNLLLGILLGVFRQILSALVIVSVEFVVAVIRPVEAVPLHAVFAEGHVQAVVELGRQRFNCC